jgi:hypothetical protein
LKRVEITQDGRGGSIYYQEDDRRLTFYWEFGGGDTIALLFGPASVHWAAAAPWGVERQQEIFEFVASDVARQKVPGGRWKIDLDSGTIEIRQAAQ